MQQRTHREADVADEVVDRGEYADLAMGVPDVQETAELRLRRGPGLIRRHAARQIVCRRPLEVIAHLVVEVASQPRRSEQAQEACGRHPERRHALPPVSFSTCATMPDVRDHWAVSASSCLRPAGVIA
jgi:hypothetical protein